MSHQLSRKFIIWTIFAMFIWGFSIEAQASFESEALKQIQKFNPTTENVIFSPLSLRMAFEMTRWGAEGLTKKEITQTFDLNAERLKHYQNWTSTDNADKFGIKLNLANSVWVNKNYQLQNSYVKKSQKHFSAEIESFDTKRPSQSANRVNGWVKNKSEGLIPSIVNKSFFSPEARIVLVNTIYFLGDWKLPFEKHFTQEKTFQSQAPQKVSMMRQLENFQYWESKDFDVLSVPYQKDTFEMLIVLPKTKTPLQKIGPTLLESSMKLVTQSQGKWGEVDLELPRFKIRSRLKKWIETFEEMGLHSPFDERAQFPNMIQSKEQIFISKIIHEAVVKVDEKGTEAAAATAIGFEAGSIPVEKPKPKIFHVDRPFLFSIRERASNETAFVGAISKIED